MEVAVILPGTAAIRKGIATRGGTDVEEKITFERKVRSISPTRQGKVR